MTIVTIFRSRLRDGMEAPYAEVAAAMTAIVASMDGFIDQKFYVAPDGERVTVVRFTDWTRHRAWAHHPDHLVAQRRGRDEFYAWYDISVGEANYSRVFEGPT